MGETEEFAEALIDQISVELNEEKEFDVYLSYNKLDCPSHLLRMDR